MEIEELEKMLFFFRSIGEEEQKVSFAFLQGMETQRFSDKQSELYTTANQ